MGWNDIGFHGSVQIPTPNIDALAYSGVILNNYYVSPVCSPSRAALLTGKHPIHTGIQHGVIRPDCPYGVSLDETLLPQHLGNLGYSTAIVGKWHIGFYKKEYTPTYRGFQEFYGFYLGAGDHYTHMRTEHHMTGYDMRHNMDVDHSAKGNYSARLFTDKAVEIIQQHDKEKPLFLYIPHQVVHGPHQAPEESIEKFNYIENESRRKLAGMILELDNSVGKIVSTLNDMDMLNNTIIVFSTDNGGPSGGPSNWPLRGLKGSLWEGGVHGAGFIWSPLVRKPKRVSDQLMHIQDWLPTLYSAAGGDVGDLGNIDGLSLWEALIYDTASPRYELLHNIDDEKPLAALRYGDYKVIIGKDSKSGWYGDPGRNKSSITDEEKHCTVTQESWDESETFTILNSMGLITRDDIITGARLKSAEILCGPVPDDAADGCHPDQAPCLFNIKEDPCEYYNLAEDAPDILQDLMERLAAQNATAVPPRNKPADPNADPANFGGVWSSWQD